MTCEKNLIYFDVYHKAKLRTIFFSFRQERVCNAAAYTSTRIFYPLIFRYILLYSSYIILSLLQRYSWKKFNYLQYDQVFYIKTRLIKNNKRIYVTKFTFMSKFPILFTLKCVIALI